MAEKAQDFTLGSRSLFNGSNYQKVFLKYEAEISGVVLLSLMANYLSGNSLVIKVLDDFSANQHTKGLTDLYFVIFWSIMFTFIRATFIKYIYIPLASYYHIGKPSKIQRVAEQSYLLAYYLVFGSAGLIIMYNSPHWFNTSQYWIDYPHVLLTRGMKNYYLMQLAFWFQQMYSLHTEKRRKDHYAMLSHHIITIALVASSYYCNLTRVGNAVLCCMDLSDIFLSLAKILKYLGFTKVCDVAFGLFAISWPITRHFFFSIVTWSVAFEPQIYTDMKWDPSEGKYFSYFSQKIFVGLLLCLNVIMFYWFLLILNVIIKLVKGTVTDDPRSDDEEESSSTDSDNYSNPNKNKKALLKI